MSAARLDDRKVRGRRPSAFALGTLAAGLMVVVLLSVLILNLGRGGSASGWVEAGSVENVRRAGVMPVRKAHAFVVSDGGRLVALADRAQHLGGEYVVWCPTSGWFESPFHGETFDRDGVSRGGPANRGLDHLQLKVERGMVFVHPEHLTRGVPKGTPGEDDPDGPFCFALGGTVKAR